MASITITANVTVDIHLEDISMESYKRLVDYINSMGIIAKESEAENKAEQKPEPEPEAEEKRKAKHHGNYVKNPATDGILAKLREAREHPDDYEWQFCKGSEWKQYVPEMADTADRQAGYFLGMLAKEGVLEDESHYDKSVKQYFKRFWLPIPKVKLKPPVEVKPQTLPNPVSTLCYQDQQAGEILRSARKGAGMTLRDLSEAIGYDASIINSWEIGRYHMAELQRKAINDYFHRDIFAEATATA